MLPASASTLFPHSLMQITGLNPLNLLFLATFGAYVIGGRMQRRAGALVPMPLAALFIAPIVGAGLIGMQHVAEIPSFFYETGTVTYYTGIQYLLTNVVKPMIMVGVILVIGAAAARSEKPERFIVPLALSMWPFALIQIGFVIIEARRSATLAAADERAFYSPLGLHANDLGRLHLFAFAAAAVRLGRDQAAASEAVPPDHARPGRLRAAAHFFARVDRGRDGGGCAVPDVEVQRQDARARDHRGGADRRRRRRSDSIRA